MTVELYRTTTGGCPQSHVGQIGQRFNVELKPALTPFNLVTATRLEVVFLSPLGVVKRLTASEVAAPGGGSRSFVDCFGNTTVLNVQLEVTITDGAFFDVAGTWSVWAEVESLTYEHPGKATDLVVYSRGAV